ncbi:MAG: hypothetical protein A2Z25_05420 [Planctomycetes bacterium RBG_16_55_9]|nr:MAG: hypothetical protein A2Z25_05420 [Planctomycetes bacterium RBG_16_55_9]
MRLNVFCVAIYSVLAVSPSAFSNTIQSSYQDRPFVQDFAEKIPLSAELSEVELSAVRSDRNGGILVLSNKGLLQIHDGTLVPNHHYRPVLDMRVRSLDTYQDQFVFLTNNTVLSNAWAGKFNVPHGIPDAGFFDLGSHFDFLLAGNDVLAYFDQGKRVDQWKAPEGGIKQILFDQARNRFLILSGRQIDCYTPGKETISVFKGDNLTCLELTRDNSMLVVGTSDGYIELDAAPFRQRSALMSRLPCTDIRCVRQIGDAVWFGTPSGAFALRGDGRMDYYASKRWLVDDTVIDISEGPDNSVLILSRSGLSIIHFEMMTLQQKAEHFDRLTRRRHIRYGFSSSLAMSKAGELSTGTLVDSDNDGLWTAMYLAGELFRYATTKSEDVLQNCYESFEAMERLYSINPLKGFPSRSFERAGYHVSDKSRWQPAEDRDWVWKATTSSDEIVGHFFVYSIFAEVIPDKKWRERAIALMDDTMDHIVRNDWYLIDYDGKPTLWGRWNPEYVNQFPEQVGDRRLNSAEIISFLQTAYHFTGKEVYKKKAYELLEQHGYLNNIMIPITRIGRVPGIDLTTEWNHSDDELAFLSYWGLYKYAFTEELRQKYRRAIADHWEIERPEKNPLWNLIYAMTGAEDFDLEETIWSLREFPLDTIGWSVRNSHRNDLEFIEPDFRNQTTRTVLPPDERPMSKYNGNAFRLDGGDGGSCEYSGDIFLLPYWLGRYLKIIR